MPVTMTRENAATIDMDRAIVADGYTRRELQAAFNLVCDPDDWKAPIRAEIHSQLFPVVFSAIRFFTGETTSVVGVDGNHLTIVSGGYRANPERC